MSSVDKKLDLCCKLLKEFVDSLNEAWEYQDVGIGKISDQINTMCLTTPGKKEVIGGLNKELQKSYDASGKMTYLQALLKGDVTPLVAPDCKVGYLKDLNLPTKYAEVRNDPDFMKVLTTILRELSEALVDYYASRNAAF